ncbi:DUF1572 domain-containing protein [bacterium]|nr:DUF1572 domain-containing protein [bacterium]MCI0604847.1 DUF1572 domain-containing protein [bacterium]
MISRYFIEISRSLLTDNLHGITQSVQRLGVEDLWWRPNEESNSIGNLILHISGSLGQWINTGIGGAPDHRIRQQEFDERSMVSKEELISKLNATVQTADTILSQIDPAKLLGKIEVQGKETTCMFAIYHMVEHFSTHAGQIVLITKLRTGEDLRLS